MQLLTRPSSRTIFGRIIFINILIWSHVLTGILWEWRNLSEYFGLNILENVEKWLTGGCCYFMIITFCGYFWFIKPREPPSYK